jgi:hypothetical protein
MLFWRQRSIFAHNFGWELAKRHPKSSTSASQKCTFSYKHLFSSSQVRLGTIWDALGAVWGWSGNALGRSGDDLGSLWQSKSNIFDKFWIWGCSGTLWGWCLIDFSKEVQFVSLISHLQKTKKRPRAATRRVTMRGVSPPAWLEAVIRRSPNLVTTFTEERVSRARRGTKLFWLFRQCYVYSVRITSNTRNMSHIVCGLRLQSSRYL